MREHLYLNHVDNKQNQQREENADIDLKEEKYLKKVMCTVVLLKESDTSLC